MPNKGKADSDDKRLKNHNATIKGLLFREESIRQLVEKIQDIIFVTDDFGNFLYMNPYGYETLGYSAMELQKMKYEDFFPDNYKAKETDFYKTQLKDRLENTYQELPVLCKNNTILWFSQFVIRVDKDDKTYYYGIARNITDRMKIEEALRESEEKYRSILESMEEGYFEVNLRGDIVFYNKSVFDMIGRFTDGEFSAINYKKIMDEKVASQLFHEYNQVYITGKSSEIKYLLKNRNNEERKIEAFISPIRDNNKNITGFRGLTRDVTEKEKILDDLRKSLMNIELNEKKYRLIAENSTDIIWVFDLDAFKFSYISPSMEKIRGVTVDEGLQEKMKSIFPQEDRVKVLKIFSEELEKDKTGLYDPDRRITFETREYTKDGHIIWVEITAKFIRNENGEVIAMQGSTRDISHRKRVEQERDKFAENIEAARLVQQEILPQKPPSSDYINIAFRYLPMEEVGGDYFTFVNFREHDNMGIFIGDVSGHGVPAALYTMMVKAVTDRLFRKYSLDPSKFLEELNNEIMHAISSNFLTGLYGLFSFEDLTGRVSFSFSKGGHPYPVYYNSKKRSTEFLESSGMAMGFLKNSKYQCIKISLNKGDRIYFYTDGLIEVIDKKNDLFGFERLQALIQDANSQSRSLEESLDYILKRVIEFSAHSRQEDDMVIIGIEALGIKQRIFV